MSEAPIDPDDDVAHFVMDCLRMVDDEHQASALLQAAVQQGHTGFAQVLQLRGVALPTGQLCAQDLQQESA
jgi:hypothetical protein